MATCSVPQLRGAAGRAQTMAKARGMDLIRFEGEEFHLIRPFLRKRGAALVVAGDLQTILGVLNTPTAKA